MFPKSEQQDKVEKMSEIKFLRAMPADKYRRMTHDFRFTFSCPILWINLSQKMVDSDCVSQDLDGRVQALPTI